MWPPEDVNCLVGNLIKNLCNDSRLSDLTVKLKDGSILYAHKFVLAARSKVWYNQFLSSTPNSSQPTSPTVTAATTTTTTTLPATTNNLSNSYAQQQQAPQPIKELDCSDLDSEVASALFTWVYTGVFEIDNIFQDEQFIFNVMKAAKRFKLAPLIMQCEKSLLAMAPEVGLDKVARLLMEGHANINTTNEAGMTLLHLAIINGDDKGAIYLLNNSADVNIRTPSNQTVLELAVRKKLPQVVRAICHKDFDLKNAKCSNGESPLWLALMNHDENIASILVENNCDTNCWEDVPTKFSQNLLHKALDQNDQQIACFLIRSGCDCNSPRRPLTNGESDEEAFDKQTPLHIACAWAMVEVVNTLLEHHADINAQDAEGRSPLHIAIREQHEVITNLLVAQQQLDLKLRDNHGRNAFAMAMETKNIKAATIILGREPHAAEKYDPKGRTFLHQAILKKDIESVLFLLSVNCNIHSPVQDSSKFTPLHLAVQTGSEMIMRNLLLAGANINDLTVQNQTALHIAAAKDHHQLCSILLENNINYDAVDADLNNALHLACQNSHIDTCKVLLRESQINAEAINLRGQNPLHLLALHGKENAFAIFEVFIECMPEYPINVQDGEGNTALLLAYSNGNIQLCRSIIRNKACLATTNKSGINIFNERSLASKNLLIRLLDYLPQEPPWSDYDNCQDCQSKFGMTNRKHHCRHCGRILCAKCSPREVVITKFKSSKPVPVRVCNICAEVLTYGDAHS